MAAESEHYQDAQQVNAAVMAMAPMLMELRSTNTTYINENDPDSQLSPADGGGPDCAGRAPHCAAWPAVSELHAAGICPLKHVSGGAFVLGCFSHQTETSTKVGWLIAAVPRSTA